MFRMQCLRGQEAAPAYSGWLGHCNCVVGFGGGIFWRLPFDSGEGDHNCDFMFVVL